MRKRTCALSLTGILYLGLFAAVTAHADKPVKTLTLDVACDLGTLDPWPPDFARGSLSVVNGNIYAEDGLSGGDPIGTWRCLFTSLQEAPLTGAVTYYFALDDAEESLIVVQGLNSHLDPVGMPPSVPRVHSIVGGTGAYIGATGEVIEAVAGVNDTGCFDLRFDFRIRNSPGFGSDEED